MKVLPHQIKFFERTDIEIKINFISSLFKILLISAIGLLVFFLTSRTNIATSFSGNQDNIPKLQINPPEPY